MICCDHFFPYKLFHLKFIQQPEFSLILPLTYFSKMVWCIFSLLDKIGLLSFFPRWQLHFIKQPVKRVNVPICIRVLKEKEEIISLSLFKSFSFHTSLPYADISLYTHDAGRYKKKHNEEISSFEFTYYIYKCILYSLL